MNKLYVGVGRTVITPELGGHLAGYASDVFSDTIHDDLTATALALQSGGKTVALISLSLVSVPAGLVKDMKDAICLNHPELDANDIMIAAIHTHSGPVTSTSVGWGEADVPYCENILLPQVVNAVDAAFDTLQSAQMGLNVVQSQVGINRRQYGPDGKVVLGQNPWGQYDPDMTVIAFRGEDGTPIANIVHYGAHNTATGKNGYITRDWAGVMIDQLDKESGAVTLFFNGCAGDVGPRLANGRTTGNIFYMEQIGAEAALDAVRAYRGIKCYHTVTPETVSGEIRLPYAPVIPLEKAKKELEKYQKLDNGNVYQHMRDYYPRIIKAYETGLPQDKEQIIPVTLIKLGDVLLVPLGYEVFSEVGLRLRAYSPVQHTLTVSYANDKLGYFPSMDQISRGGYEILMSRTKDLLVVTEDADDYLIRDVLRLIEKF